MKHRCPRCRGVRAERRTPRNSRERAALAVLGYHPYRCLDCERRFLDRPLARPAPAARRAPRVTARGPEPAARRANVAGTNGQPPPRRRVRWVVDPGNNPLGRAEVYALVLAGALLLLLGLAVLRVMWPEVTGGVRLTD
jgi:hypothetical protein